jgi:hypothetical protein
MGYAGFTLSAASAALAKTGFDRIASAALRLPFQATMTAC